MSAEPYEVEPWDPLYNKEKLLSGMEVEDFIRGKENSRKKKEIRLSS
jgi:hypothetical protein